MRRCDKSAGAIDHARHPQKRRRYKRCAGEDQQRRCDHRSN
jgi:hypothetical protein